MWKLKYLSIYLYIWQTLILTHDQQVSSFLVRYLHINVHVSFQCVESLTKWSCMLTSLTSILKLSGITTGLSGVFLPTFAVLIRPGTKFAGKILIVLMYALPSSGFLILWFYDFPPWCCYEQFDFVPLHCSAGDYVQPKFGLFQPPSFGLCLCGWQLYTQQARRFDYVWFSDPWYSFHEGMGEHRSF